MMDKELQLRSLCIDIMKIDHVSCEYDDYSACRYKHELILELDKLDKHTAIRLLMHVLDVKSLVSMSPIDGNPFLDMSDFRYLKSALNSNEPIL